jgi:hypothetical protein
MMTSSPGRAAGPDDGKINPERLAGPRSDRVLVRKWVEHARADRTHGTTGLTTAEREELARLRTKPDSPALPNLSIDQAEVSMRHDCDE